MKVKTKQNKTAPIQRNRKPPKTPTLEVNWKDFSSTIGQIVNYGTNKATKNITFFTSMAFVCGFELLASSCGGKNLFCHSGSNAS